MDSERGEYGRLLLDRVEKAGVSIEDVSVPEGRLDYWTIEALEVTLRLAGVDIQGLEEDRPSRTAPSVHGCEQNPRREELTSPHIRAYPSRENGRRSSLLD